MAIHIRNKPSDADRYRVIDLKITGVDYNALSNRTTLTIDVNDTNHDAIEPGYFMIPQKNDDSPTKILHPLKALEVVDVVGDGTSSRSIIIKGNQLSKSDDTPGAGFFQHNSPALTTAGFDTPYRTTAFTVDNIRRNRKYRIKSVGTTEWEKFGDLYRTTKEAGKLKAAVDVTFSANASGAGGDSPQIPKFFEPINSPTTDTNRAVGAGGARFHSSPTAGYKIFGLTGDLDSLNGVYNYVTSSLFEHTSGTFSLEKRTNRGTGRWTIYNPLTQEIFFEDANFNSGDAALDSPVSDSPQVVFEDRTQTVPTDSHGTGTVVEVGHFSNVITDSLPLTNNELDNNFLSLENTKLARDGSMDITGNQKVFGKVTADNLDIEASGLISLEGDLPSGTNTFLNAGTKDIECNDVILTGTIKDDTLFRKYYVSSFPHSILGYYNTKHNYIEPTTILYFTDVAPFTVGSTLRTSSGGKTFYIRRKDTEFNYILVSEKTSASNFAVGETMSFASAAGPILKVVEPKDYLAAGQNLKIFGLQQRDNFITDIGVATVAQPSNSFAVEKIGTVTGTTSYTYKIAHMDRRTGIIGVLSEALSASHTITGQVAPDLMNNQSYNRLTGVSRGNANNLILLYRQLNGGGEFDLINIYGDDELGSASSSLTLNDYGLYNKTEWGVFSGTNGLYNQRLNPVYIPLTQTERDNSTTITRTDSIGIPPVGNKNKYSRGFIETTIADTGVVRTTNTASTDSPSYIHIQETSYNTSPNINVSTFDSPGAFGQHQASGSGSETSRKNNELEFFIDNARVLNSDGTQIIGGLQKLIEDAVGQGLNKIELPAGTYYSKLLTLPSNFKLEGNSRTNTFIKSLPWNFTNTSNFIGGTKYLLPTAGGTAKTAKKYFNETVAGAINTAGNVTRFNATGREGLVSGIFNKIIRGAEAYSRVLIDMDGRENVQISSITLDGSLESNIPEKNTTTGKGNSLVTFERGDNIFLSDTTVRNTSQAGIFAELSTEVSLNNVNIQNGGNKISTSVFATGVYAPEAKQLRIQSSLIENFSSSNDLTTNSNSSLVGNIIRNTGSGVLVFASSNINKAANLILGPADELIPMVDTLNSEYDELNVNLLEGGDYASDIVEFRRDGISLDLGKPVDATDFGTSITSKINTLVELGTNQYFLNDSNFDFTNGSPGVGTTSILSIPTQNSPSSADPTAAALSSGNFQLKITSARREVLNNIANFGTLQTNYNALINRPVTTQVVDGQQINYSEKLVGLIFQVFGTQYTFLDGDDVPITAIGTLDIGNLAETVTIPIDNKFAGLISVGDKIVWQIASGETNVIAKGFAAISYITSGTDMLSNPIVQGYNVSAVVTDGTSTRITVDIPTAQRTSLGSASGSATLLTTGGVKIGIRNTFVLSKGRIII